uniref:Uncharacterized protein n=1 Tax=Rhizophora mucronata TaxID=61149 RepID=A0A2P2KPF4_RHIMU
MRRRQPQELHFSLPRGMLCSLNMVGSLPLRHFASSWLQPSASLTKLFQHDSCISITLHITVFACRFVSEI